MRKRNFRGFYFRGCGTLWPHPYQLMATPHMRNGTERRSEEAGPCNNGLIFLLCGGFRNYEGIKTAAAGEKPYSALLISTSTTSERHTNLLVFCIVAGFLFFTATIYFRGQTDCREPSRSHRVNSYRRICTTTSSISVLLHFFFAVLIFAEAGLSAVLNPFGSH